MSHMGRPTAGSVVVQGREYVRVRHAVWSIAAGVAAVALCGLSPAGAAGDHGVASTPRAGDSIPVAQARLTRDRAAAAAAAAPPVLLARAAVPVTPVVAIQPQVSAPAVVAQGSVVRAVAPEGSQPGVLWVIAMGAVLYRMGARLLRVS